MVDLYLLIIHSLVLLIVCISPIPAIPFLLTSYKINGIYGGFFTACFGGLGSALIHYYIGRYFLHFLIRKKFRISYNKVVKLSKKIRKISIFELILLMLSAYIPSLVKCAACGAARMDLKKMIIACLIAQIPTQMIFIFVGSNLYNLENKLFLLTNNKFIAFLLGISISSLVAFTILLLLRLFPKIFSKTIGFIKINFY